MATITSETKVVYVPMLRQIIKYSDFFVEEGPECRTEDEAIAEGKEMLARKIDETGKDYYVRIEHLIVPIYK